MFICRKFIPEMDLRQPGFTIQRFKETGDSHIYQNELDRACFQHDMALKILKI